MLKILLPILLATALLSLTLTAYGQKSLPIKKQKAIPAKNVSVQIAEPTFLTGSFDPSVRQLPKGFKGHDFNHIYGILERKKQIFKDEFQTTESYQKALALNQALSIDSKFAILFGGKDYFPLKFSYDADAQTVTYTLRLRSDKPYEANQEVQYFKFASRLSEYKRNDKTYFDSEGIVVINPEIIQPISFKTDPENAKVLKESAKFIAVFHLKTPYYYPQQIFIDFDITRLLVGKIDDIWVINPSTGQIFGKLTN